LGDVYGRPLPDQALEVLVPPAVGKLVGLDRGGNEGEKDGNKEREGDVFEF